MCWKVTSVAKRLLEVRLSKDCQKRISTVINEVVGTSSSVRKYMIESSKCSIDEITANPDANIRFNLAGGHLSRRSIGSKAARSAIAVTTGSCDTDTADS